MRLEVPYLDKKASDPYLPSLVYSPVHKCWPKTSWAGNHIQKTLDLRKSIFPFLNGWWFDLRKI